jgi:hypothetical protein
MDKKAQLTRLWSQLKASVSVHETVAHHEHLPKARLRQMESRSNPAVSDSGVPAEGAARPAAELIDALSSQRATVCDNQLRWSCNPDKGIKQEIRKGNQLSGVARGFSIDPLVDMEK